MAGAVSREVVERANRQSRRLRELVRTPEMLIMPGAHDTGTAVLFETLGFKAIQGSSGGIAAVFGLQDGEVLSRDEMVEVYRRMVEAVDVPVNADGERGYGGPAEVAETVRRLIEIGAAGMNLEDGAEHRPGEPAQLLPLAAHLEKLAAVNETKQALGSEFFLNARVDTYLTAEAAEWKLEEGIRRGNAYAEHGADCIFYIGVSDADTIRTLVKEVQAPVSILAGPTAPPVKELEALGVARVSYGTAFARLALTAVKELAEVLLAKGDPAPLLSEAMTHQEMLRLFRGKA